MLDKRTAMIWFPDPHERRFFIHCMSLIAEYDRGETETEDFGIFKCEFNASNLPWDTVPTTKVTIVLMKTRRAAKYLQVIH